MKIYLPQTAKIEDFLSTLEDIMTPGTIKTRAVIEVDVEDKNAAAFLAQIDGNGAEKKRGGRPKAKVVVVKEAENVQE